MNVKVTPLLTVQLSCIIKEADELTLALSVKESLRKLHAALTYRQNHGGTITTYQHCRVLDLIKCCARIRDCSGMDPEIVGDVKYTISTLCRLLGSRRNFSYNRSHYVEFSHAR